MLKICDSIMGSGKSSAIITYINEHPEKRFLYIAPYLDESERIKDACPDAKFILPSDKIPEYYFSKARHTMALVKRGCNVSTTHQAVRYYTDETLSYLRKNNYTIIIDEEINIFHQTKTISDGDVYTLCEAGQLKVDDFGCLSKTDKPYTGDAFEELFDLMETRKIVRIENASGGSASWYSIYPKEFLESVDEVIVLTYLFTGSEMEMFLKINNIGYEFIGVEYNDNKYRLIEHPGCLPEYTKHLKDMIHVIDDDKLNSVGNAKTALSMSWFKKHDDKIKILQNNIYNFFRHKSGQSSGERLCGVYTSDDDIWNKLKGKGYTTSKLAFNCKATNEFRQRNTIAYLVNLYPNVGIKMFYQKHGYDLDDNRYALSTMVQFLWRSAIRDGKEIWVYLPSKRMRTLLLDWMENLTKGGAASNETTEVRQVPVSSDAM